MTAPRRPTGTMRAALLLVAGVLANGSAPARATCGDGVLDPGEQCDPGPDLPDDCCTAACQAADDGSACGTVGGTCTSALCVVPITFDFVRVRPPSHAGRGGTVVLRGAFPSAPPADTFAAGDGIELHMTDGATLDQQVTWEASDCTTFPNAGIRCNRPGGASRKIRVDQIRGTARWHFVVRMKDAPIAPPFAAPVTATIDSHTTTVRSGSIDTCSVTASGTLNCRPPR